MGYLIAILGAYLLGSVPFSHIFPRIKGRDVRKGGTGNVGATNALVVAGPVMGVLAFIGDIAKGYLAVTFAAYYFTDPWLPVAAGIAAVLGHVFSVFLKFKGGKGLATSWGGLLGFDPVFALIVMLTWILLILATRYFILSSLINAVLVPVLLVVLGKRFEVVVYGAAILVMMLYTHRQDIKRIISGNEMKTDQSIKHYLGK